MKKFCIFFILLLIPCLLFAYSYYYDDYSVDITVSESGVFHIKEEIRVNYLEPLHGIIRDIQYVFDEANPFDPVRAEVKNFKMNSGDNYSLSKENGFYSYRIGDSNKTIVGPKDYSFEYDFYLGPDRYSDYDEIYTNFLSSSNDFPIKHFSYSITLPSDFDKNKVWLTYGKYGSTEGAPYSSNGLTLYGELSNLKPLDAVTIRLELPEGYFINQEKKKDFTILTKITHILLSFLLLYLAYSTYKKYGVDEDLVTPVRFNAPEGLGPLEVDYLLNGYLDGEKDSAALLFYWADKGYLDITDRGKENFIFKANRDLDEGSEGEKAIYHAFFGSVFPSATTINELGKKDIPVVFNEEAEKSVSKFFSGKNILFSLKARNKKYLILALTLVLGILNPLAISIKNLGLLAPITLSLNVIFAFFFILLSSSFETRLEQGKKKKGIVVLSVFVSLIFIILNFFFDCVFGPKTLALLHALIFSLSFILSFFLGSMTQKRSDFYTQKLEEILGYKDFIETVEKDKLKLMIDEDPALFYHVLSYAVIFDAANEWAEKFDGLYIEKAYWYHSDTLFNYLVFTSFYDRWRSAYTNQLFSKSALSGGGSHFTTSGSSGFSGGGFSGGGSRGW